MYYSNHVHKISYFLRYQLYKNLYELQPEDGIEKKKPKHVAVVIFNYVLTVFTQ